MSEPGYENYSDGPWTENQEDANRREAIRDAVRQQVADLIFEHMNKLRMSLRQLGRALGHTSAATPMRLLRGTNMTLGTLSDVADCFGCKVRISFEEQDQ